MYFHDSDLVLLNEQLNHPYAFGAPACVLDPASGRPRTTAALNC